MTLQKKNKRKRSDDFNKITLPITRQIRFLEAGIFEPNYNVS